MGAITRERKLNEIVINSSIHSYKELVYKNNHSKMPVYQIPVEYLIFNQYNGRIGTFVKQHEKLHGPIDATTLDGETLIESFLWNSKEVRNRETYKDICEKGQLEYGIVTKDGVIIDGNRRCMLLKKKSREKKETPTYFLAVILDETLQTNPKEIRKLETTFQMGVDAKVDYNPVEKYLKCQELVRDGFDEIEIEKMMGEDSGKVKEYLKILKLMESYLAANQYDDMYRLLDEGNVEGPFVDLRRFLDAHSSGKYIQGRDWLPDEADIDDLKLIYFDVIRALKGGTHDIRHIGDPGRKKGIFNFHGLWEKWSGKFIKDITEVKKNEISVEDLRKEYPANDIEMIISEREKDFRKNAENIIRQSLASAQNDLFNKQDADKPLELLTRALKALEQINSEAESFEGEDVKNQCHAIRKLAEEFIKELKEKEKVL